MSNDVPSAMSPAAAKTPKTMVDKVNAELVSREHRKILLVCNQQKIGMKYSSCRVTEIKPGAWAASAGVQLNDVIYKVNGLPFGALSGAQQKKLLLEKRPLKIEMWRRRADMVNGVGGETNGIVGDNCSGGFL